MVAHNTKKKPFIFFIFEGFLKISIIYNNIKNQKTKVHGIYDKFTIQQIHLWQAAKYFLILFLSEIVQSLKRREDDPYKKLEHNSHT